MTERDIAPDACLFISIPVTDGLDRGRGEGGVRCVHRVKGDGRTYTLSRSAHGLLYVFVHGNRTGRVYTVGRKNLAARVLSQE